MLCIECGGLNDPGSPSCTACGARFSETRLPPHLEKGWQLLVEPTPALAAGQLTLLEYTEVLEKRRRSLDQQLSMLTSMEMDADTAREVADQMSLGLAGIRSYLAALDTLQAAAAGRDGSALERGLEEARAANTLLNAALTRNWQGFNALKQAVEEMLPHLRDVWGLRWGPKE